MKTLLLALATVVVTQTTPTPAQSTIVLKNDHVLRELRKSDSVWKTTRFARADGSDALTVCSDEFQVLLMDNTTVTLDDYTAINEPEMQRNAGDQTVTIAYRLRDERSWPAAIPRRVTITYSLKDDPYLRKQIVLEMAEGQAIDRLQVERFTTAASTRRGGRGEPVFLNDTWFAGLEYPASYIRHGQSFQYRDYQLRNPSKIFLDGRDEELGPMPDGLVTMAHFPGFAKRSAAEHGWVIQSKSSVFGIGRRSETIELSFLDYLDTIRRGVPRSFLHHNNWYDASGKDLSVENYIEHTFCQLRDGLAPYNVTLDAMVPDSGWQDGNSIWQPKSHVDFDALKTALEKESRGKTRLGLWLALNGYSLNVNWGVANGYIEADRNEWFQRFKRYYALTDPKYNATLREALKQLIDAGDLSYFKHDFNEMCDLGAGRGHLPTDRHGHEANVDAMIELLAFERQRQPDIYLNLTNWIWFSPWWLMHADCLWMMGSDSGSNWAWPQLAVRDISTTFRDEHFARLWSDPLNRPLIPISSLMTHGIIFADRNRRGDANETLHDWSNYVMMYYGRGVMLKELYLTPSLLTPEHWKVLGMATRWATQNAARLVNTVAVGGNPERGEVHGYVSWTDGCGLLTLRNPDRREQTVRIPFDQTTWYRGQSDQPWHGRVIYPYVAPLSDPILSGHALEMTVPGDSVMVYEFQPGESPAKHAVIEPPPPPQISIRRDSGRMTLTIPVPDEDMLRCDLVIQTFQGNLPPLMLNGEPIQADRHTEGTIKAKREIRGDLVLGQAVKPIGMGASNHWTISSIDLRSHRGRTATLEIGTHSTTNEPFSKSGRVVLDAWWIADRAVTTDPAPTDESLPFAISQHHRRQTKQIIEPTSLDIALPTARKMEDEDWQRITAARLRLNIFGVNGGSWGPIVINCNGKPLIELPRNEGGDRWETVVLKIDSDKLDLIREKNVIQLQNPHADKFKIAGMALAVQVAGKTWATSETVNDVFCSSADWKFAEGTLFKTIDQSPAIPCDFARDASRSIHQ